MLVVSILPLNLRFLDWIFNYSDNVILFVCNIFGLKKINFSTRVVIRSHKLIDRQDKGWQTRQRQNDKRSNNDQQNTTQKTKGEAARIPLKIMTSTGKLLVQEE